MNTRLLWTIVVFVLLASLTANAQMIKRQDAIYARVTTNTITVDGKLNEPDWAVAESIHVNFGQISGLPGGGWYNENARANIPSDPTDATIKFLAKGDSLYVAYICRDKSIGGGDFNLFDGFLCNVRYRQSDGSQGTPFLSYRTNQACELFYAWCNASWADTNTGHVGAGPGFLGDFGSAGKYPRPDSLRDNFWDAACYVNGVTNDDSTPDTMYTFEVKINAKTFGYNITQVGGDAVMWSTSIYDADWQWPWSDSTKQSNNRTWAQCPWSNASAYSHMRVFVDPAVTTTSGAVPTVGPDIVIPGSTYADPTIDGVLNEPVWSDPNVGTLQMKYNDNALRDTYPYTAKYRSGQNQQTVNGASNQAVVDPNPTTIKYFFKGDFLYLGFDVSDKVVQGYTDPGTWQQRADGFRVSINDRGATDPGEHVLLRRALTFIVDTAGHAMRMEDLANSAGAWDSSGQAVQVALVAKGNQTQFDTLARASADIGYSAEMKIDLTKLGYPSGRGDGVLFLGITEFDGDSFSDWTRNYGTHTWFMREGTWDDGAAWAYMDPSVVLSVDQKQAGVPGRFQLLGNYPNPFNPSTTVKFEMARTGEVTLEVYNVLGQRVSAQSLGVRQPGANSAVFDASALASGTYVYRLKSLVDNATLSGKMLLLK